MVRGNCLLHFNGLAQEKRGIAMTPRRSFLAGCLAVLAAPLAVFASTPKPSTGIRRFVSPGTRIWELYDGDFIAAADAIRDEAEKWYRGHKMYVTVGRDKDCHTVCYIWFDDLNPLPDGRYLTCTVAIDLMERVSSFQAIHREVRRRYDYQGRRAVGLYEPDITIIKEPA
jgi:hypothetical protein